LGFGVDKFLMLDKIKLGGAFDMAEVYVVLGVLMAGVYGFLLWLSRSYSNLNREVGELRQSVERNTRMIEEMRDSMGGVKSSMGEVKKDVDQLMDLWRGWIQKKK